MLYLLSFYSVFTPNKEFFENILKDFVKQGIISLHWEYFSLRFKSAEAGKKYFEFVQTLSSVMNKYYVWHSLTNHKLL